MPARPMRARWRAAAGMVLAAALLCAGCSVNPRWQLARGDAPGAPLLLDVPFHPQTEYQCGPAALATVLGASGVATSPEALVPQVYLPGREGSLQLELVAATRRAGRIPYVLEREPDALLAELQDGRPVLVLQNLLVRTFPRWHYAVLVGSDPAANTLLLNSGTRQAMRMAAPGFLRTWDWGGRWAMVALRPGEVPAGAEPVPFLAAVADFEAVAGHDAARPAYEAALQRWPAEPKAHLAMGNAAYAAGDLVGAATSYRTGLALEPGNVVLGNNHASVLGELGCKAEAGRALAVAIAAAGADGQWRDQLERTQAELERASVPRDPACDRL